MDFSARVTADVAALVECESFSADFAATARCAALAADIGEGWLGARPEQIDVDGRRHVRWSFGSPRVLLLGHVDTVWPMGTLAQWPFSVDNGRATGPGVFDMKVGIVQLFAALAQLSDLDGVTVLLTGDEEIGSPSSRALIEQTARGTAATFVLEPGIDGRLKTARKGVSSYTLAVTGRAAHAGLEPEKGVNAAVELAHLTRFAVDLADAGAQTTVTPSGLRAGTATNVVPAAGELDLDVRAWTAAEQRRVDDALRARTPLLPEATVAVRGGINRPPLEETASRDLFALAVEIARDLGQPELQGGPVGGASDGNFTAGVGSPTLDGLGAVGAGAHAAGEWADLHAIPDRAALLTGLVERVLHGPLLTS